MLNSLINLIYPKICYACGKSTGESVHNICLSCRGNFARIYKQLSKENKLEAIFWGRLDVERASAYLKFEKGNKVQRLLYALKYQDIKAVGTTLGEMAALELSKTDFFTGIDHLIPVPIHRLKRKKEDIIKVITLQMGLGK